MLLLSMLQYLLLNIACGCTWYDLTKFTATYIYINECMSSYKYTWHRRVFILFLGRHVHFLGWTPLRDHPPPKTPPSAPTQTKRVPICSFLYSCIHLHTHQDLKLKCCRVIGQKFRYGRPCTHDLPGTHNCLHSPILLPFLQNFTVYLMLTQSWKFGVNCSSIGLAHPAACTRDCVPLTFGHVHRPTLLPDSLKKGGNWLGLS